MTNDPTVIKDFRREGMIAAGGLATGSFTALLVYLVATLGFDISSFMFWFIVPIGSILCGAAAASGFFLTSRIVQHPPTFRLALSMVVVGVGAYFLIKYLAYLGTVLPNGQNVSHVVPFWTYYKLDAQSTHLQFFYRGRASGATTGSLGELGYVYEGLRIIGFFVGGLALFFFLLDKPYCRWCGRYYGELKLLKRASADEANRWIAECGLNFPGLVAACEAIARNKHGFDGLNLSLFFCPACDRKEFRFSLDVGTKKIAAKTYPYKGQFAEDAKRAKLKA